MTMFLGSLRKRREDRRRCLVVIGDQPDAGEARPKQPAHRPEAHFDGAIRDAAVLRDLGEGGAVRPFSACARHTPFWRVRVHPCFPGPAAPREDPGASRTLYW
jgi:hypothetical protein